MPDPVALDALEAAAKAALLIDGFRTGEIGISELTTDNADAIRTYNHAASPPVVVALIERLRLAEAACEALDTPASPIGTLAFARVDIALAAWRAARGGDGG